MASLTHEEFVRVIEKGLGKPIAFDARPHFANLKRSGEMKITLKYDWIKNYGLLRWAYDHPEIEIEDGSETWITIWNYDACSQSGGAV